MNVVSSAKLTSVVVSPCKDVVASVDCRDEATPQLKVDDRVGKIRLELWLVHATREERCCFLQEPYKPWECLIGVEEPIACPGAERPPPSDHLLPVDYCHVCLIACRKMRDVLAFKRKYFLEVFDCGFAI